MSNIQGVVNGSRPIFFQFASSSMHFASSLEICSQIENSAEVNYFFWGSSTSFPNAMNADNYLWPKRIPSNLVKAIHNSHSNVKLSTQLKFDKQWVASNLEVLLEKTKKITLMGELTQLDNARLAPSAAISNCLTNLLRQRTLEFSRHHLILRKVLKSYLEVYSATKQAVQENPTDLGIVFNGRFLHERACWDALKALSIPTQIFEVTRDRYFIRAEGFHDRHTNQMYVQDFWECSSGSQIERQKEAKKYYEALRYGKNPYVRAPETLINEKDHYFVYFANSDDEAFGFWESWKQPLGNQLEVIRGLQKFFDDRGREKLIIRLHPNFVNKSIEEKDIWNSIVETPFSKVIGFMENVSSYSLMSNAKGILTFGSTIGLESAYWRKPVAVLADCYYDELGVADKISDWATLQKWIESDYNLTDSIINSRHIASFKRPWYLSRAGSSFLNSRIREIGASGWGSWEAISFKGIKIRRSVFLTKVSRGLTKIRLSSLRFTQ